MKAKEFVFLLSLFSFRGRKKEEEKGMISVKEKHSEVSKIILNKTLGRVIWGFIELLGLVDLCEFFSLDGHFPGAGWTLDGGDKNEFSFYEI